MSPSPEATERMTLKIFSFLESLVLELRNENDQNALEALPPVLLTTGVITLLDSLSIESVLEILDAMKVRVERGDFSGLNVSSGQA